MIKQFFIISSAIIMITGFLLIWDSPPESFLEKKQMHADKDLIADSYMRHAKTSIFGSDGQRTLSLITPKIELFIEKGNAFVQKPFISANRSQSSVHLSAKSALLDREANKIFMSGDVQLQSTQRMEISTLSTENLTYNFDLGLVENEAYFTLKSNNITLTGNGFTVQPMNGSYQFKRNVQAQYEIFQ